MSMLTRAEALASELDAVFRRDLASREVSAEALNLTHEVLEKCSNALDQTMHITFEYRIRPLLSKLPKRGGYFPVAKDEHAFRTAMGAWGAADLASLDPELNNRLRMLQPYADPKNGILLRLRALANQKHTGLTPQVRVEQPRMTATNTFGGKVSWDPRAVKFGPGVRVAGALINPATQRPIPTQNVEFREEVWVNFIFIDGGEDALNFCRSSIIATRRVIGSLLD